MFMLREWEKRECRKTILLGNLKEKYQFAPTKEMDGWIIDAIDRRGQSFSGWGKTRSIGMDMIG